MKKRKKQRGQQAGKRSKQKVGELILSFLRSWKSQLTVLATNGLAFAPPEFVARDHLS
jgi:hypothetical protein